MLTHTGIPEKTLAQRPSFKEELPVEPHSGGIIWIHQGNHYDHPRHRHDAIELNLVVAGQSHYEVDGKRIPLCPGSLLWIYPDQDHQQAERTPDFEMWIVALHPRFLEHVCEIGGSPELLARLPKSDQCRVLPWEEVNWLDRELEHLASRDSAAVLNAGLSYCTLGAWESFHGARPGLSAVHPEVEATLSLLETDPTLSRLELATRVGVGPTRLSRIFAADFGIGLAEYRTRIRVERFAELVLEGKMTFLEACLQAGFGSYAQGHRAFVAHMGCTPRTYAMKAQKMRTRCT